MDKDAELDINWLDFDKAVLELVSGSQEVNHEFNHYIARIKVYIEIGLPQQEDREFRSSLLSTIESQTTLITERFRAISHLYGQTRSKIAER